MVMVDSYVWIDTLRNRETPETQLLEGIPSTDTVAIADLCVFEVLQGVRPDRFEAVYEQLRELSIVAVGGEVVAVQSAHNAKALRARGVQPTVVDCLLATYCIMNGVRLLTADRDFEPFAEHLGPDLVR